MLFFSDYTKKSSIAILLKLFLSKKHKFIYLCIFSVKTGIQSTKVRMHPDKKSAKLKKAECSMLIEEYRWQS